MKFVFSKTLKFVVHHVPTNPQKCAPYIYDNNTQYIVNN